MKVRTFYAASMQEAIRAIKEELGGDAVILSSRRVRKWGNAFGVLGSSALEVVAAIEEEAIDVSDHDAADAAPATTKQDAAGPSFERSLRAALTYAAPPPAHSAATNGTSRAPAGGDGGQPSRLSQSLQALYTDLVAQGLRPDTAYECLRELQDTLRDPDRTAPHFMLQLLRGVLTARLRAAGPLLAATEGQTIALFAGPSGVGKTTSIAKLATQYRVEEKRSVAMVTVDQYRPAAVEQLRLYANVLGIELVTASTCEEARDSISQLGHIELVLVDTPGFNPRYEQPWSDWTPLASLPSRLEIHLVLSATTRIQDIDAAVKRCAGAPTLRLLFTKLDETSGYGSIFEAAHHSGLPLSYWGTGPRVPEDLAPAVPERLIDFILGATMPIKAGPTMPAAGDASGMRPSDHRLPEGRAYLQSWSVTSAREHHHE
jgi:flagellar biosynthesis protein FlhF